jgi:hypothetical protein
MKTGFDLTKLDFFKQKQNLIQHLTSYFTLHLLWCSPTTTVALPVTHCPTEPEPPALLSASLFGSATVDIPFVDMLLRGELTKGRENQKCFPAKEETLKFLRMKKFLRIKNGVSF